MRRSIQFLGGHFQGRDIPYLFGVLVDGAIAAELSGSEGIQDGPFGPLGLVEVGFIDLICHKSTRSCASM